MTKVESKPPGTIYTFYSYKGGVGRSMALANVGALLAKWGKRVLLVDWDLEAPGLEVFFERNMKRVGSREKTPGVVDMLQAVADGSPLDWRGCLLETDLPNLQILHAGRADGTYQKRVQELDWVKLFERHRVGNYIDDLRDQWRGPEGFDYILIDSRTGITDIGDICTVLFPDVLVLFFVSNYQNVLGIKRIVARAREAHQKLPVDRSHLLAVPVPSRDEVYTEYAQSQRWKEIFAEELGELYVDWLPREVTPSSALSKLFIPYVTNWSFGERLPVLEQPREIENPTSISAAYGRLATLLQARLDWGAIDVEAKPHELQAERSGRMQAEKEVATLRKRAHWTRWAAAALFIGIIGLFVVRAIWFDNIGTNTVPIFNNRSALAAELVQKEPDWEAVKNTLEFWVKEGTSLEGLNLAGAYLEGVDLSNADLTGVNFSKANLERSDLTNATLAKTNFDGATLDGAVFRGAEVDRAVGLTPEQLKLSIGVSSKRYDKN